MWRVLSRGPKRDRAQIAVWRKSESGLYPGGTTRGHAVLADRDGPCILNLASSYGAESQALASSRASSQVTLAFLALDSEIRYASEINVPGQDSSTPPNYYVEFQSSWNTNAQDEPQCTQLEYNNAGGELEQRSWYVGGTAPAGWQVLASSLKTSVSSDPFSLSDAASPWQLSMTIGSVVSSGSTEGAAQSSFTITAVDTTASSTSQNVCGGTP